MTQADSPAETVTKPSPGGHILGAMTARILIVEDEPAIGELIAVNLRHAGYTPVLAHDAASARQQIDAALPDLLLLDWMLPDSPGIELARRLLSRRPSGSRGSPRRFPSSSRPSSRTPRPP